MGDDIQNPIANGNAGKSKSAKPKKTLGLPAKKSASSKKTSARKSPAKKPPTTVSPDDIALRAYYISEQRHREGRHGDSHQDWLEAERQLIEEKLGKIG